MNKERKINGISEFLQMSMTNNMPLSVNEKRQIFDLIIDLQTQLQQKENIIKEVRDKLNTQLAFTSSYQLNYQSAMSIIEETKSILQGVDKNGKY